MENGYIRKPLNTLVDDLQHIVQKSTDCYSKFSHFHELICEEIVRRRERVIKEGLPFELFSSLSVSNIKDDYFSIEFLGREYFIKYTFNAYSPYPGSIACYLVLSFPSTEYRKVDSLFFTEHGHTDEKESDNETPIVIASSSPLLYILLSWLDRSLYA